MVITPIVVRAMVTDGVLFWEEIFEPHRLDFAGVGNRVSMRWESIPSALGKFSQSVGTGRIPRNRFLGYATQITPQFILYSRS